jgi:hypothetical protein
MEMTWLVALKDLVWILCSFARFSMILSGIRSIAKVNAHLEYVNAH